MGFDEILLTDLHFPTVGKLDKISYAAQDTTEPLVTMLAYLAAALEGTDTVLSLELPSEALLSGQVYGGITDWKRLADGAERVYVTVTPDQVDRISALFDDASVFVPQLTQSPSDDSAYLLLQS